MVIEQNNFFDSSLLMIFGHIIKVQMNTSKSLFNWNLIQINGVHIGT